MSTVTERSRSLPTSCSRVASTPAPARPNLEIVRTAVEGLLEALDDEHTHFMTPEDVEKMSFDTQASFGGIGIVVSMRNGKLTVVAPMSGTPGERAGIVPGDVVRIEIEGLGAIENPCIAEPADTPLL